MTSLMKRIGRAGIVLTLAVAFAGVSVAKAEASFVLRLTDVNTAATTTITDEVAGDLAIGIPNSILFIGTVGNFTLSFQTATTNNPGSLTGAIINITGSSIRNVASGGNPGGTSDTLKVEVSADSFTLPSGSPLVLSNSISGTTTFGAPGTSVTSFAEGDAGNALFGATATTPAQVCAGLAPGGLTGACSGPAISTLFAHAGAYSLTGNTFITLNATSDASRTLNYTESVAAIPEPATLALFGTSLFGFGVAMRRRRQK